MRDIENRGEQLRHSESRATEMLGQPQGAKAGSFERSNLVKRVLVVEISSSRASADLGQQVSPFG
jgi:hypothetical protein